MEQNGVRGDTRGMTGRKCQTCKHYESSPIWRKGWCRNPLLYSPQQSHLVGQDDLDCSRGLGSYWEPIEAGDPHMARERHHAAARRPSLTRRLLSTAPRLTAAPVAMASGTGGGSTGVPDPAGGTPMSNDPLPHARPPRPQREGHVPGQERTVSYQPEERYWTDYLRIALPVIGLLLMLGLFWFWASSLIGDGEDDPALAAVTPTVATELLITPAATPFPTPPPTPAIAPTQNAAVQPGPTSADAPTAAPEVTVADTVAGAEDPEDETFAPDDIVVTNDEGVRFRPEPSTDGNPIAELPAGTELTVTGEPIEAGDPPLTWYPVRDADGTEGFVAAEFLDPST